MGLFKRSKESSNKGGDKAVAPPPPADPPAAPQPEVVVNEPPMDPTPAIMIVPPLTYGMSEPPVAEYQPRPTPPNGKAFVSPLASWLEEYGSGPFLSRDGVKPQYPGKKDDTDTSSSADGASTDKDKQKEPASSTQNKPAQSKAREGKDGAEPSEFHKVKRSSARHASSRQDPYEDKAERAERSHRGSRENGTSDERSSRARSATRNSDSSYASEKSSVRDSTQGLEKVSREKEGRRGSRPKSDQRDRDADVYITELDDVAVQPSSVKSSKSKPSDRSSELKSKSEKSAVETKLEKPASESHFENVDDSAGVAEEKVESQDDPALEPARAAGESIGPAEDKNAADKVAAGEVAEDEVAEDAAAEDEAAEVRADEDEVAENKEAEDKDVEDKPRSEVDMDMAVGDGKKIRALDTGSEPLDAEKYTSDGKDVADKDSELMLLKDKLKQLQQKLAEERADKLDLQKKLKDRDREIFSLSKQLDKLEAQAERYEKFERFGADGGSAGSRASLAENDAMPMSERDMRSADDLQVALKAFKEHSNAKLQETFKQNADLRHQVESYETLCRTIGEVLRDYEWLQQCRIVTGDLDYSRLRKAMMKLWHTGKTRSVLPVVAMVLAFGPDEVSRCRHVLNSAKQDAEMVDYIPEIIEHNMDETMKRDAITVYIEAHKQLTEDTEIALYLTDRFAERYKGEWHCVVGEQYALSSCYESKVIKFKSGHRSVILWSN